MPASLTAAQVVARGTTPHLFAEPTHSFLLANPWIQKVPLLGPAGETQILEQELEKAVLHLGFTTAPLDAARPPDESGGERFKGRGSGESVGAGGN